MENSSNASNVSSADAEQAPTLSSIMEQIGRLASLMEKTPVPEADTQTDQACDAAGKLAASVQAGLSSESEAHAQDADTEQASASNDEIETDARMLSQAREALRLGEIYEQELVAHLLDFPAVTAGGFMAARILAERSKRPDVVLPYLNKWIAWLLEKDFNPASRMLIEELSADAMQYGRVPTLGYLPCGDIMTHLKFHPHDGEE